MIGGSVTDTTHGVLIANLSYDQLAMPNPVLIGDTLRRDHGQRTQGKPLAAASRHHRVRAPDVEPPK
jgi:hypothetical protein